MKQLAEKINLSFVDKIVQEIGRNSGTVIPILQAIQEHYRYVPEEAMERVCELTDITPSQMVKLKYEPDSFM